MQAIGDVVTMAVERVHHQEEEQRGRQRERLASVGQAAAGMAHDFNNVISAIGLYAELLQRQPRLDEAGAEHLAVIRQQVAYGTSLVWQLLDSAHGEGVESVEVDLTSFLAGLLPVVRRTAPDDVVVSLDAGGGPYTVRSDPTRLQQVFMNLATNATDALGGGGAVDITISRVGAPPGEKIAHLSTAGSPWVRIDLTDTGSGMHPDVAARAFEPFFTTKPPGRGTGLGLAQVHALVSQLGGHVEIDTSVVRGTRVSVWLSAVGCRPTEKRCEHVLRSASAAEGELRNVPWAKLVPANAFAEAAGVGVGDLR